MGRRDILGYCFNPLRQMTTERINQQSRRWGSEATVREVSPPSGASPKIQLWDNATSTWSVPLESAEAYSYYLRKIVAQCTGCHTISLYESHIESHLVNVRSLVASHQNARVEYADGSMKCLACATVFTSKPGRGMRHLSDIRHLGPLHQGARVETIMQFSLRPPVPGPTVNRNGTGPAIDQVLGKPLRRKRNRRRGKSKG